MSIAWMNYVWEHSDQKGTSLLLLLAIADHANDDGICWPSVARLAHKARTTKRQAQPSGEPPLGMGVRGQQRAPLCPPSRKVHER